MAAPLFPPHGVGDGDALCPRPPGGLHAPAGRVGDTFTVPVTVWTPGEGEGAGGITAGKARAVSMVSGASWSGRALRSPGCVGAVRAGTIF